MSLERRERPSSADVMVQSFLVPPVLWLVNGSFSSFFVVSIVLWLSLATAGNRKVRPRNQHLQINRPASNRFESLKVDKSRGDSKIF